MYKKNISRPYKNFVMASTSREFYNDDELLEYVESIADDDDYIESDHEKENMEISEAESDNSDVINPRRKRPCIISDSSENNESSDSEIGDADISSYSELEVNKDTATRPSHVFREKSGPKHAPPSDSKAIEYFNLFFTHDLWLFIVNETNRYATDFLNSHQIMSPQARAKKWKPVTIMEMKAFVAVLLEMGITRRPNIFSYWAKNSRHIPWFGKMFSRNRFQLILKFFHLVDNTNLFPPGHKNYDPCAKFQPLVEHANLKFRYHYTPHQELSVDESLIGTKCHTELTQYLPNKKHHKWGIKFWMLCDSVVNYCLGFFCYRGAKSNIDKAEIKKYGLGHVVVTKLLNMGNYLNKGFHIFMDNFFTSTSLAKYLYNHATYLTGTIRRNRKGLPNNVKSMNVGQAKYFRNVEVLLCGYREKKSKKYPVLLISTKAIAETKIVTKKRRGQEIQKTKPSIIIDYNKFMGGVDGSDMMLYTYLDERRTVKYWKKVVFYILGRMVLNAYIIYKENTNGTVMSRLKFTSSIIESIEQDWLAEKGNPVATSKIVSKGIGLGLEKLPGRNLRRCIVCSNKDGGPVKRSNLICSKCKKGLHGLCIGQHKCS